MRSGGQEGRSSCCLQVECVLGGPWRMSLGGRGGGFGGGGGGVVGGYGLQQVSSRWRICSPSKPARMRSAERSTPSPCSRTWRRSLPTTPWPGMSALATAKLLSRYNFLQLPSHTNFLYEPTRIFPQIPEVHNSFSSVLKFFEALTGLKLS
jgi:hypothetical protein